MYNVRLFKSAPDGTISKRLVSNHIEVYEKDCGIVLLTIYDDYTSRNGVEYKIHGKTANDYSSVIVKLNDKIVYKYVV